MCAQSGGRPAQRAACRALRCVVFPAPSTPSSTTDVPGRNVSTETRPKENLALVLLRRLIFPLLTGNLTHMAVERKISRPESPSMPLRQAVLDALAFIRAKPAGALDPQGLGDSLRLKSQEIICILVRLESVTGINPRDPAVLKGCNAQELGQFLKFLSAGGKTTT